jgi:hypothetical protein
MTFVTRARSNRVNFWLNLLSTVGVNDLSGISLTAQRKVNAPRRYWRGSHVRVLCNVEKCRGDAELRGSEWSPLVIGTWTASSHLKENTIHSRGSRGQCAHVPRNAELYQYSFFFSFNAVQNFCIVLFCIIPMRIKECRDRLCHSALAGWK